MDQKWKIRKSAELMKSPFFRLRRDECELPDGRIMPGYYVLEFTDWVNVVPVDSQGQVILLRQYRHGTQEYFYEIPGGTTALGGQESALLAAQRELREETGYASDEWQELGYHCPNPALQNNRLHTFLALNCARVGELQLDPFEDITVLARPVAEVLAMMDRGEFRHALILASLALARPRLEKLC